MPMKRWRPMRLLLVLCMASTSCTSINVSDYAAKQMAGSAIRNTPFYGTPLGQVSQSNGVATLQTIALSASPQLSDAVAGLSAPTCSATNQMGKNSKQTSVYSAESLDLPTGRKAISLFDIKLVNPSASQISELSVSEFSSASMLRENSRSSQVQERPFDSANNIRASYNRVLDDLGTAGNSVLVKAAVKSFFLADHPESAQAIDKEISDSQITKSDISQFSEMISGSTTAAAVSSPSFTFQNTSCLRTFLSQFS